MPDFPIDKIMPELRRALAAHPVAVLQAPPGAGKTTRLPLGLLDESWLAGGAILMQEPRRLAARGAAAFMAATLGEPVGGTVGYRVRFDSQVGPATRIEVITEGILARRLQDDPELCGVGLVIFDEFHERHLHSDLALALCLDSQGGLRPDLRVLIMSATLDGGRVASMLQAPLIVSEGRSHPVTMRYLPPDPRASIPGIVRDAVLRALREEDGDILAFLPGAGEINGAAALLQEKLGDGEVVVHALYGDLALDAQQRALVPDRDGRRKVVLASPIAETSLTIEGVSVVVDSGWMRVPRFDPGSGLTRLQTVRVSRASADQRSGRAGRLGPGTCYRLWGEGVQRGLIPHTAPEIIAADLAPLALELALWGVGDASGLTWMDPPPAGNLAAGRALLTELGALDRSGGITALGRRMSSMPVHPRLARMLIEAEEMALGHVACDLAALLSERDVLRAGRGAIPCDFSRRLEALGAFRSGGKPAAAALGADPGACAAVERSARQLRRLVKSSGPGPGAAGDEAAGLLLAIAYPDRIAMRKDGQTGRYQLSSGKSAMLDPGCALGGSPFLVAADLDGAGSDGRIRRAAAVSLAELEQRLGDSFHWTDEVCWDGRSRTVVANRVRRLGRLALAVRPLENPGGEEVTTALLAGLRAMGPESLPWTPEARNLQARIESLRAWFPDEDWPDVSDEALMDTLEHWLGPYVAGVSRWDRLSRLDLHGILLGALPWERQQRLDQGAPVRLRVPSGSMHALTYVPGQAPVLAVKLQELFGLAETPAVAWGRIPVLLHLLSPARRPIQVTQDLKSFWERTYPEVKKELKGRYPKHPWPDDPWSAVPTARTKPRPR